MLQLWTGNVLQLEAMDGEVRTFIWSKKEDDRMLCVDFATINLQAN